jgi:hypothetical protein
VACYMLSNYAHVIQDESEDSVTNLQISSVGNPEECQLEIIRTEGISCRSFSVVCREGQ